jgi:hypothetical protein
MTSAGCDASLNKGYPSDLAQCMGLGKSGPVLANPFDFSSIDSMFGLTLTA